MPKLVHVHHFATPLTIRLELGEVELDALLDRVILERIDNMDDKITQGLADIASDIAPMRSAIDALVTKDTALADQLKQAIDDAENKGASDEQLQQLKDFHSAFVTDIDDLNKAALAGTGDAPKPDAPSGQPTQDGNAPADAVAGSQE